MSSLAAGFVQKAISLPSSSSCRAPTTYIGYAGGHIAEVEIFFALQTRPEQKARSCCWRNSPGIELASILLLVELDPRSAFFGFFSRDKYDPNQQSKSLSPSPASSRSSIAAEKKLRVAFESCSLVAREQENSFMRFTHSKVLPQLAYVILLLLVKDNQLLE